MVPSARITGNCSRDAGGPWLNWNCGRKSPLGVSIRPVTDPYSSLGEVGSRSSTVATPKPARTTNLLCKFHARPTRGWKLFQSLLYSSLGWMIRPFPPATRLSAAFGSKLDNWPYLLFSALCTCQRTPRFKVRFGRTFQSSWKYREWSQLRGRALSRFLVIVKLETEPHSNWERAL